MAGRPGVAARFLSTLARARVNLRAIHKRYGERPLKQYKTISFFDYYLWYPFVKKMRTVRPLNYMPYVKAEALVELQQTVGYKPYPRKHGESLFTKLFQNYYLPTKFGYDKRRPHLSSLIVSGQLTRQEALAILSERRAVKGKGNYPALCAAIRSQVESLLETIAEARTKRADLANGDAEGLYFWTGDKRLQAAFCEGADLDSFPA